MPSKTTPVLGALLVLGLALAVFLLAGWDVRGWAIGAILWAGIEGLSLLVARLRKDADRAAETGLRAFELGFKAIAVLVVLDRSRRYRSCSRPACDPRLRARLHG